VIGTDGTKTPFLPESDLPEYARINREPGADQSDEELARALQKSADEAAGMRFSNLKKKRYIGT